MPSLQDLRVGHEHVVADELHAGAERAASASSSRPSRLRRGRPRSRRSGTAAASPRRARIICVRRAVRLAGLLEHVAAAAGPELARRDVERDEDVLAGLHARPCRRPRARPRPPRGSTSGSARSRLRRRRRSTGRASSGCRAARERSRRRSRSASANDGAPTGITMNSWKSTLDVGVRAAVQDVHHRHRQREARRCRTARRCAGRAARRCDAASARAAAIETPSSAFAPSRLLVGVPSSAIIAASSAR